MPHQKSTVLSVCFIYQRSAYLEAIVIEHYRLYTYFSGIVPSIRIRKWVNWYADCLSLKPFQNQLCHWFSAGTCISFLNAMCCSARVQWGQTHVKPVLFFIQLELPLTSREILPQVRSQAWKLKTAAFATLSVWATHGNISDSVPSSPPLFTGLCFACFRVRTRDFKKLSKGFPHRFWRAVSPLSCCCFSTRWHIFHSYRYLMPCLSADVAEAM